MDELKQRGISFQNEILVSLAEPTYKHNSNACGLDTTARLSAV
jgi:hypothetical protein